ncbi:MAG: hypothetical protein HUJ89_06625 [Bacteroidales bacterium]|nr:hypothetical protein [Bacteroidales bacterium]
MALTDISLVLESIENIEFYDGPAYTVSEYNLRVGEIYDIATGERTFNKHFEITIYGPDNVKERQDFYLKYLNQLRQQHITLIENIKWDDGKIASFKSAYQILGYVVGMKEVFSKLDIVESHVPIRLTVLANEFKYYCKEIRPYEVVMQG